MKKIGLLGGTFDPVHGGHLKIAEAARREFRLDKVIFIPALTPPHKIREGALTPAHHRYQMTFLAIQGRSGFEISDLEINRGGISYTVDTLREFCRRDPYSEFFLIVGADAFQSFKDWRKAGEIQKLAKILVAPRAGVQPLGEDPDGVFRISMKEAEVSSSDIREKLAGRPAGRASPASPSESEAGPQAGRSPEASQMLPEKVWSYIREHRLYLQPKSVS